MAKKRSSPKSTSRKSTSRQAGTSTTAQRQWVVERVQTGVRMEKRMVKVLKGLAEYLDISMGDLLESVVLYAFDGKCAFTEKSTFEAIKNLKRLYELDLDHRAGHRMVESGRRGKSS